MLMAAYSAALSVGLLVSSPWWLARMMTTQRYREGLRERLGRVPARLRAAVAGRRVVWVHAVSVGEVLAVSRLVRELESSLNENSSETTQSSPWLVVLSTTTRTGQALARERFGADRVFYFPLDFAWAVRAYLRVLRPALLVLAEGELWPRMLYECARDGVPVAVVNARVSDRSFRRSMRVRALWARMARKVSLWLAQSDEDARRLVALGARADAVRVSGNLKYDVRVAAENAMSRRIRSLLRQTDLIVAGSTVDGEEAALVELWTCCKDRIPGTALLIAPRHPERFDQVLGLMRASGLPWLRCSDLNATAEPIVSGMLVLLDTIGDLGSIYGNAQLAFVGGSLAPRGGHNPLEPAQFGVPVVMGPSFENFRDVVTKMQSAAAIRIVQDKDALAGTLVELLTDRDEARALGARGRQVFEQEGGATARSIEALMPLVGFSRVQVQEAVSA